MLLDVSKVFYLFLLYFNIYCLKIFNFNELETIFWSYSLERNKWLFDQFLEIALHLKSSPKFLEVTLENADEKCLFIYLTFSALYVKVIYFIGCLIYLKLAFFSLKPRCCNL